MGKSERNLVDDNLFAESLEAVKSDQYLGSAVVVEMLLRSEFGGLMDLAGDGKLDEATVVAKCNEVAGILLGKDPTYVPVASWNREGAIDVFLKRTLELSDESPADVMQHFGLLLVEDLLDVAEFAAQPGVLDEQWQSTINDLYRSYTMLAMGIPVDVDDLVVSDGLESHTETPDPENQENEHMRLAEEQNRKADELFDALREQWGV